MPGPQREELGRFIAACAKVAPSFRWTPTENLHLTIRFVGSVDRAVVEGVADALSGSPLPAFKLELDGVDAFGRGGGVRVVWLGLRAGAEGAGVVAAQVEKECLRAGLVGEARPFKPHLTLARARDRAGLPELPAAPRLSPWQADELNLYSSRLTSSGAVYEVIRKLPLS